MCLCRVAFGHRHVSDTHTINLKCRCYIGRMYRIQTLTNIRDKLPSANILYRTMSFIGIP